MMILDNLFIVLKEQFSLRLILSMLNISQKIVGQQFENKNYS